MARKADSLDETLTPDENGWIVISINGVSYKVKLDNLTQTAEDDAIAMAIAL